MKQTLLSFLLALLPLVASAETVEIDGIYYNLIPKAKQAEVTSNPNGYYYYPNGYYTGEIVIPEKVLSDNIEYDVTKIGDGAFSYCSGLTSLTIPNSVTSIGNGAFSNCIGLTSLTIPNSVTSIGNQAFWACSGLKTLTIPNSVTSIGSGVFYGCDGLESLTIPNSVTSIGTQAFSDCSGLTSLTIPNSVKSIGGNAFQYCRGLTTLTIPNSVTSISVYAFSGCKSLTSITIGSGVTTINSKAFESCSDLTDVYCYADNVPFTSSDAFEGSYIEYATLHVPESAIEAYSNTAPWSGFKKIVSVTDTNNFFEMTVTVNNAHGAMTFGESNLTDGTQTYNVKEGTDVALTLTAEEGYKLASVTVDGVDKTADVVDGVLTISNVTADLTVNVKFATAGETVTATIGSTGMATFCSTSDLDFSEVDGLTAYTGAGFNRETGVLTILKVMDAPAGTGLVVMGSKGTYEVPVKTSASVYANLLVGVTEETTLSQTAGGYVNYILAKGSHGLGFYVVEGEGQLAAGKAYLRLPAAVAGESRSIAIEFADDATGIEGISGVCKITTDEWFDLQGRRIAKPSKAGIYLNNGHKIVVR